MMKTSNKKLGVFVLQFLYVHTPTWNVTQIYKANESEINNENAIVSSALKLLIF